MARTRGSTTPESGSASASETRVEAAASSSARARQNSVASGRATRKISRANAPPRRPVAPVKKIPPARETTNDRRRGDWGSSATNPPTSPRASRTSLAKADASSNISSVESAPRGIHADLETTPTSVPPERAEPHAAPRCFAAAAAAARLGVSAAMRSAGVSARHVASSRRSAASILCAASDAPPDAANPRSGSASSSESPSLEGSVSRITRAASAVMRATRSSSSSSFSFGSLRSRPRRLSGRTTVSRARLSRLGADEPATAVRGSLSSVTTREGTAALGTLANIHARASSSKSEDTDASSRCVVRRTTNATTVAARSSSSRLEPSRPFDSSTTIRLATHAHSATSGCARSASSAATRSTRAPRTFASVAPPPRPRSRIRPSARRVAQSPVAYQRAPFASTPNRDAFADAPPAPRYPSANAGPPRYKYPEVQEGDSDELANSRG